MSDFSPAAHSHPRFRGDDGAVIIEAAMVLPVLLMLVCGVVDFGGAFKQRLTLQGGVRIAARQEAVLGTDPTADQFALSSLWATIGSTPNVTINKVIVWKADATGTLPSNCKALVPSATGQGRSVSPDFCNVYGLSQIQGSGTPGFFNMASIVSPASCNATGWDRWYCPATRGNSLAAAAGPDYLGFYLDTTYTPYTKIFKPSFTLDDQVVVRIEPIPG